MLVSWSGPHARPKFSVKPAGSGLVRFESVTGLPPLPGDSGSISGRSNIGAV